MSTRNAELLTPNERTQTLAGTIAAGGTIAAERTMVGVDKKPYAMTLSARVADGAISGTYATPRCRYAVKLGRP